MNLKNFWIISAIVRPVMMNLRHILLCMKQYSSWMSRKIVLHLIFVNFWIRISENHADISVRNGGFIS